jgi:hypothetical protein
MLLSRPPADLEDAQLQASFYGVGVYVFCRGELDTVLEPEQFTESGHTPAQWRFNSRRIRRTVLGEAPSRTRSPARFRKACRSRSPSPLRCA